MSSAELDRFLNGERTCRVATASPRGPHLTALWYVWDGTPLWLTSVVRSQRWTDLERDPRVAVRKYTGRDVMHHDGRHAWLRLVPDKITSWDFSDRARWR